MHLLCSYQLVNCPAIICSPSMLVIYHGETPLVNCGPRSIFYIWNTIYCNHLLSTFPTSNFHHPHYTINPLWSASWWDWQPHCYVGTKFLGCVVRRCLSKSYWFDNLGFFLRENLLLYSSYLPLRVSQQSCDPRISNLFSGAVAGAWGTSAQRLQLRQQHLSSSATPIFWRHIHQPAARGVSHFQPFYFVYCLA